MSISDNMRERRAAKKAELDALLEAPTAEKRDPTTDESTKFDFVVEEIRKYDERLTELDAQEAREAAAVDTRKFTQADIPVGGAKVTDPPVYPRGDVNKSYFRDLFFAQHQGDREASDRLTRNDRQSNAERETRALTTVAGAGGKAFAAV